MTHLSEAILHDTNGLALTLSDPMVAAKLQPYADFFVIDAASRPMTPETVQALMLAAKDKPVLVRVENTLPSTLQHYLNLGVDGLILTNLHYAAEVEKAIAACLYPPEGVRAWRPVFNSGDVSLEALNDQITLVVEIAHPQAVAQIEEIAEVTGINGVLLVPQRLAVAMEQKGDAAHVNVQQAMQSVVLAARSYDLPFGIEGAGAEDFNPNFRLMASDAEMLAYGIDAMLGQPGMEAEESDALHLIASR